ncbi:MULTISPECIES: hypothetical protein [Spirosoma]|nr:hypothetical protein [Spirosoma sp. 209]
MKKVVLLFTFLLMDLPVFSQLLRAINPKRRISSVYYSGDQVQIRFRNSTLGSDIYSGQIIGITRDSVDLSLSSVANQKIAVSQIMGLRRRPSLLSSVAAGLAIGATIITLIDKRDPSSAPRIGLSLVIGAGVGVGYWQVYSHRKRIRQEVSKGWSFQIR